MRTFLRYLMVVELAVNALLLSDLAAGQETLVSFEQEIQAALSNRVYGAENAVGIVVGILTPEGRQFLFDGLADRESGEAPGPRTMFRIGFTTSLFSSLLLSDMVVQGELSLDDPISDYLQASVQPPAFDGREITLADLATGTSGLPIRPLSYRGPPFGIRVQDLYDSLSSFSLSRAPAEMYEASIFDEALLVAILSRDAGMDHAELMRTRVFDVLGMESTTYEPSEEQGGRVAATYNADLSARPALGMGALDMGAGLYSTADDLLTFAEAFIGSSDHPLEAAMRQMTSVVRPVSGHRSASSTHLGWLGIDGEVYFMSGAAYNHTASLAIHPGRQRAVVVLVNNPVDLSSIESISFHGVMPEWPLLIHPRNSQWSRSQSPKNFSLNMWASTDSIRKTTGSRIRC